MRQTDLAAEEAVDNVLQHNKRMRPSVGLGALAMERSSALDDVRFRLPASISLPRPRRHVEHENHTLFTRIQNIPSRTD
jgi:hypothetical protein